MSGEPRPPTSDLSTPSRFWRRLGAEHTDALDRHGMERVKRTQALRYFTWRWRPGKLARSEQLRFLVRHSHASDWRAALRLPWGASGPEWDGVEWSGSERRAYVLAVRLLWCYALRHGDPVVIALDEPTLGAPLPVRLGGQLISQDLANSALEVTAIVRALGDHQPTRIVEIGAGYGRSAYALLHRFPNARYTVVDIEPAASISRWYLSTLFPGRVEVIDPSAAGALSAGGFDLGLSISSLQEMRADQIDGYLSLLDRVCAGGTVYLKQWAEWHNPDDDTVARLADYPIPARWQLRFTGRCPVQTHFTQAAWVVPAAEPGAWRAK
ncbi:MAG TPA: putative sugar O-methyltransferase [Methylomirabilota bacterium]|nr:putative sugar O-methyltransferase [Methylomirabilota bacterium]